MPRIVMVNYHAYCEDVGRVPGFSQEQSELVPDPCRSSLPLLVSFQVRVVQGPGPEVVQPAGGLQYAAGDRGSGVHLLPLQRLVHGHGDRREGLL